MTLVSKLLSPADVVLDLCTPPADALVTLDGLDTPVGPGSTIAAVANQVGYGSPYALSIAFKRAYGVSPKVHRLAAG